MNVRVSFCFLCICLIYVASTLVSCSPMKGFDEEEEEEPHQNAYEINPHFGFRKYFEIRYEPLTVPFEYNNLPQQGYY